jgi:polyhydroxybutyrate depolymerase
MPKYWNSFLLLILTQSATAQLMIDSILVDSHYRIFYYNNPKNKNSNLIFAMHGSGGNAKQMISKSSTLEAQSKKENIILVYPEGYKNVWNECRKAATTIANIENIDEGSFFNKMISYFEERYQANKKNVFAIGFSGGGHMAYKLAITMPSQFKAIVAVAASMPEVNNMDCSEEKKPVGVMIINGTADSVSHYLGGEMKATGMVLGQVRSTEKTFQYWTTINGCSGTLKKQLLPDPDTTDSITIEKNSYQKSKAKEVILLKVINGKHEFPKDIDVFAMAWAFFKRQRK